MMNKHFCSHDGQETGRCKTDRAGQDSDDVSMDNMTSDVAVNAMRYYTGHYK
jgi:hypothetical protein